MKSIYQVYGSSPAVLSIYSHPHPVEMGFHLSGEDQRKLSPQTPQLFPQKSQLLPGR